MPPFPPNRSMIRKKKTEEKNQLKMVVAIWWTHEVGCKCSKKKFEDINGVIRSGERKTNNDQHYTETKYWEKKYTTGNSDDPEWNAVPPKTMAPVVYPCPNWDGKTSMKKIAQDCGTYS